MKDLPGVTICSRCGAPTAGVELSPGSISSVCRPGEGCNVKTKAPKEVKESAAPRHFPKNRR